MKPPPSVAFFLYSDPRLHYPSQPGAGPVEQDIRPRTGGKGWRRMVGGLIIVGLLSLLGCTDPVAPVRVCPDTLVVVILNPVGDTVGLTRTPVNCEMR